MDIIRFFCLGVTTAAKDYLKGEISAKFYPSRSKSKSCETFLPRILSCSIQISI